MRLQCGQSVKDFLFFVDCEFSSAILLTSHADHSFEAVLQVGIRNYFMGILALPRGAISCLPKRSCSREGNVEILKRVLKTYGIGAI